MARFRFDARDAEQGQSFLSKPSPGDKEPGWRDVSWREDVSRRSSRCAAIHFIPSWHPRPGDRRSCPTRKFRGSRKAWSAIFSTTGSGRRKQARSRHRLPNLVLDGQDNTLNDLIASADADCSSPGSGTSASFQPKTWQLTGLTRDGVFLDRERQGDRSRHQLPLERKPRRSAAADHEADATDARQRAETGAASCLRSSSPTSTWRASRTRCSCQRKESRRILRYNGTRAIRMERMPWNGSTERRSKRRFHH